MYLVQVGLCLCLISKRCYAGLTKDIEQTKILKDGLGVTDRELTQGERDFAMFPELSSKALFSGHGESARLKAGSPDVNPAGSATKASVPTGSQARFSSAIDSHRSSEDGSISSLSEDKQHTRSVPLYEQYTPPYGDFTHRDFQGQLSHHPGNFGFEPHAMHPFPITNQHQTLIPNKLPAPDVLIPAFLNAEDAARHSPVGQVMAVISPHSAPGPLPSHWQAPPLSYDPYFPHESHLGFNSQTSPFSLPIEPMGTVQRFWPPDIPDTQHFEPRRKSRFYDSTKSYNKLLPPKKGQEPPRTALDSLKIPEREIIPQSSSKQGSKELNRASSSKKAIWKKTDPAKPDQSKSVIPMPEHLKSSEKSFSVKSSHSSDIDDLKSATESLPIASNDLESNQVPVGRSKILDNPKEPSTSTPVETSSPDQDVENVKKQVTNVESTTPRLWADIVSQSEKEKNIAQSFLPKGKHIDSHGKGKPFEKPNSRVNSQPGSGSNTKTRASESGSLVDARLRQQDSEWKEYRQKKGRKGRFLTQKPAQESVLHSEVDRQDRFEVPDGERIPNEAGPHSHLPNSIHNTFATNAHPSQDAAEAVTEPDSQGVTEFPLNSIPDDSNPKSNELIESGSSALKIKTMMADKNQKPRTKAKGKSRKTKTKAQIGSTQGNDNLDVSMNVIKSEDTVKSKSSFPPEDEIQIEQQMSSILSKVLQRHNKKNRAKVDFDEESFEKLFLFSSSSGKAWSNFRMKFQSEFIENPLEAHRRWNAFAAQLDQRLAIRNWNDLSDQTTVDSVKSFAIRLKIDKEWPTFDQLDLKYGQRTIEMLEELNPVDQSTLSGLFGNTLFKIRIATIYVVSRRSPNAKQFEKSQLVEFMKRGGIVPILYEIHDCLEMHSTGMNWDQISKEELKSRLDRILKAISGKISIGNQILVLTKQGWPLTWTREYLSRLGESSSRNVPFLARLKTFYGIVNDKLDPYPVSTWWGESTSETTDRPVWMDELLTPGQVLAGAHFDISVVSLGLMIHTLKQNSNVIARHHFEEKTIWWPPNAPTELLFKAVQFRDFYEFCGYKLKTPMKLPS
ncbi:hypothetical protein DFH28DRAFT_1085609 [Melampsora americana]|nr:hypothetical protein DFH28DRAFT_1085609 [Melampsora americana]